ncbi:MAG: Wzy polymerase domain-containing protein [Hylemonella sp.]|uniref:PglL family O-oligosaccharyltransferase n=1 Tax=Hylemonella sp. TaxID=2066020 RepID=UPI0022C67187|nr:O-antigen ligase family protein [Hylemonella sp.]MCZ8252911.1 Wzy polymerase domain-containing protein [Hylemonella sp.]
MKLVPGFLLLLASWLQPLHVLPWVSWHSELLAFAALAWFTGLLIIEAWRAGEGRLSIPPAACLPMALGLYALFQFGAGQIDFFGDALMIAFYLIACGIAVMVGYQWGTLRRLESHGEPAGKYLDQLAAAVLAGALASVCIMLVQTFEVWDSAEWVVRTGGYRRPGGNTGQPNHMATLLLMGMASLVWLYETGRFSRVVTWLLQLLLILGVAMTESRTGLLSAAVLTIWWFSKRGLFAKGRSILPMTFAWGVLLLLVWLWPVFITSWHESGASGIGRIAATVGVRGVVWGQLLDAALQRPWTGWGLREVSEAHNAVLHRYQDGAPFSYAHNLFLDLVVGVGFPLALLVMAICLLWLWSRARKVQTLSAWYGIALGIPLAVHSMLEFPHAYAYFLMPILLAVGATEAGIGARATLNIRTTHAAIVGSLLLPLMVWTVVEYVRVEEDFRVARFEALRLGHTPEQYAAPETTLLTQLDAMLKATRLRPAPGMESKDIDLLRRAAMRFPWTAIQNRYALSLALNGQQDEAMRQLRVMRAMHGEKHYEGIRANWELLAEEKYPQLQSLQLP